MYSVCHAFLLARQQYVISFCSNLKQKANFTWIYLCFRIPINWNLGYDI